MTNRVGFQKPPKSKPIKPREPGILKVIFEQLHELLSKRASRIEATDYCGWIGFDNGLLVRLTMKEKKVVIIATTGVGCYAEEPKKPGEVTLYLESLLSLKGNT